MARVGDLRKGLKDRLSTINGLRVYATMPVAPQTPSAAVIPRTRRIETLDGGGHYDFEVWVYVNPADLNRAQTQIDEFLSGEGPNSVETAIEDDVTLGGVADSTSVTGWSSYAQLIDLPSELGNVPGARPIQLLGARIDVEVLA